VRSGYTGSQALVPMVWGGDPEATFDETQGMPASLRGGLNLGMSGVPVWGSDVSGFKCLTDAPNDKEVYLRWVELGAVSPVFEEEDACANPVGPQKTKWSLFRDQETQDVYREMTRLHTRLGLYLHALARDAHDTGVPITRHPFLLHPKAAEAARVEDAFYLGPGLFTAPVVRRGKVDRTLWLPPGRFVALEGSDVLEGNRVVTVAAPLRKLPLWLTENAVVPMYDAAIDTLAPSADDPSIVTPARVADRLDVLVAPGTAGTFRLVDGTVLSFEKRGAVGEAPADFARVAPADLASCARCVVSAKEGGVVRTRVTGDLAAESEVLLGGLVLRAKGPTPRRVRWDVRALP
jgi:alpha-glucosidase (family GH31 glycosyl hydrolase)